MRWRFGQLMTLGKEHKQKTTQRAGRTTGGADAAREKARRGGPEGSRESYPSARKRDDGELYPCLAPSSVLADAW
jgi:hypothetical protein